MYVKLQKEFQENKLSREAPTLAARKQCRSQPARRNASPNESFPSYDQNLKALRLWKSTDGCGKEGQQPTGLWGVPESRLEGRKGGWN